MRQRLLFAVSCALVALLATAVYLPGLQGPFVYGDLVNIIYNRTLHPHYVTFCQKTSLS